MAEVCGLAGRALCDSFGFGLAFCDGGWPWTGGVEGVRAKVPMLAPDRAADSIDPADPVGGRRPALPRAARSRCNVRGEAAVYRAAAPQVGS
jgi:hypothetical protein